MEGTTNNNADFKSGHWFIIKACTADRGVYQFLRFVLAFDERKIKNKIVSWLY